MTLADARDGKPAFGAEVAWLSGAAVVGEAVPRLTFSGGVPPVRWTAEAFYGDYAFHGPSFHGLRRVTAVAADGIEAELIATELPGLDAIGMDVDPALLDCAGQLVALWLLEVEQLPATVGVFPYAARRVWLAPMPAPGTPVHARGRVRFIDGVRTEADFEFTTGDRVVVRIEGLAQRVLRVPGPVARLVFGGGRASQAVRDRDEAIARVGPASGGDAATSRVSAPAVERAIWRDALTAGGGLFARVVAPQLLRGRALATWRERPDIEALVAELATREDDGD